MNWLKKKYKWFSNLKSLNQFFVIVGIITIVGFLMNVPMFISWLNSPKDCYGEDYQVCKQILEEFQTDKMNNIYVDEVLFNHLLNEKYGLTETQIQNLAENFKKYAKTEYDKSIASAGLNRYHESILHLNNAIELDDLNPNYYYSKAVVQFFIGDFNSALITINTSLRLYGYGEENALVVKARILEQLGRVDEALAIYDYALSLNPNDFELWNDRGIILGISQEYEEAIISFNKALYFGEPDDVIILDNKGIALMGLQRYEDVISIYTQIIERTSDYQKAYDNRGHAYFITGNYQKALDDWKKSLQMDGEAPYVCRLSNVGLALLLYNLIILILYYLIVILLVNL